jgi:hypothetical protein
MANHPGVVPALLFSTAMLIIGLTVLSIWFHYECKAQDERQKKHRERMERIRKGAP